MKCHYEVLGVARNASDDDIKKAYKKLALKWHPDKNLDNQDEAKEQFQLVQQAWDILSDSHERAWYDNHREAILKDGIEENYKDESINLFPYFSASCFKSYRDDEKGFYTVYRKVFEKLAAEDAEFAKDSDTDEEVPNFGDSKSSYEEVVRKFYSYWQSYSTKRSYIWLDTWDLRNVSNRRIFRYAEKKNKKVRDKARHERNEQVRNLVAFVRKRDKRVQAYAGKLAERARENFRKVEERRKAHLLERQKLLRNHTESEWSKFSNIEAELKNIEANLTAEFGIDDKEDNNKLYCLACNKIFKTHKAFMNHEKSKRHKEKISMLKDTSKEDEWKEEDRDSSRESDSSTESASLNGSKLATDSQMPDFLLNPVICIPQNYSLYTSEPNEDVSPAELISDNEENSMHPRLAGEKNKTNNVDVPLATGPEMESALFSPKIENETEDITSEDELISDQEEEIASARQKKKKKKKKRNVQNPNPMQDRASGDDTESINEEMWLSKKQRKKLQQRKVTITKQLRDNEEAQEKEEKQEAESESEMIEEANLASERPKVDKAKKRCKREERKEREESKRKEKDPALDIDDLSHRCISCASEFPSKNKLFEHLKKTGHSVYIPELTKYKKNQERKREDDCQRKRRK